MDWFQANQVTAEVLAYLKSIGVNTRSMTDRQIEQLAMVIHHDGKTWNQIKQAWGSPAEMAFDVLSRTPDGQPGMTLCSNLIYFAHVDGRRAAITLLTASGLGADVADQANRMGNFLAFTTGADAFAAYELLRGLLRIDPRYGL